MAGAELEPARAATAGWVRTSAAAAGDAVSDTDGGYGIAATNPSEISRLSTVDSRVGDAVE